MTKIIFHVLYFLSQYSRVISRVKLIKKWHNSIKYFISTVYITVFALLSSVWGFVIFRTKESVFLFLLLLFLWIILTEKMIGITLSQIFCRYTFICECVCHFLCVCVCSLCLQYQSILLDFRALLSASPLLAMPWNGFSLDHYPDQCTTLLPQPSVSECV